MTDTHKVREIILGLRNDMIKESKEKHYRGQISLSVYPLTSQQSK